MIRCSKRSTFQCPNWSLNRFAIHLYLCFFNQAGSATGYFVANTCKINTNLVCLLQKRSVLAYGLQSRIVWNFMKFHFRPETHSCARDGKNQESFVRNVRVKCFKQLWYWISGIIALFLPALQGLAWHWENLWGLNVTFLDMRLFAFFCLRRFGSVLRIFGWFFQAFVPSKTCSIPWWFAYL